MASGVIIPSYDKGTKRDILEFDYTVSSGSVIRLWAKDFPEGLAPEAVDRVEIGVQAVDPNQIKEISLALVIEGDQGTQTIPLDVSRGWNEVKEDVSWPSIGRLSELAFVLTSIGDEASASGTLRFALAFHATEAPSEPDGLASTPASFSLLDAAEQGLEKTNGAKGYVLTTFDDVADKDVLEFDYTLPEEGEIRVWTREYPAAFDAAAINTVKTGIRVLDRAQVDEITLSVEITGSAGTQSIPLVLAEGWNAARAAIDWERIGTLREVAFRVRPSKKVSPVNGTLYLAIDFIRFDGRPSGTGAQSAFPSAFNLLDAQRKGVFNIGPSQGTVHVVFDETVGRDVLAFTYSAPRKTHVGVWTQAFPEELSAETADAVRIGIKVPERAQVNEVSVKVEIKSKDSWQTVPLRLQPGWNYFREFINWSMVGHLDEVVFVVSPMGVGEEVASPMGGSPVEVSRVDEDEALTADRVSGTLYFDLSFGRLTFLEKNFTLIKAMLVIFAGFLLAFLTLLVHRRFGGAGFGERTDERRDPLSETSVPERLKRDLLYGTAAVAIVSVTLYIYALGTKSPLDAGFGFGFLFVALSGAVIAAFLKFGLTGRHLTPGEMLQNVLFAGFVAASSSRQALWQTPATWIELLTMSNLSAAILFLIYQISNIRALAASGRPLKPLTASLMAATPVLFGWLLLLQNSNLLASLTGRLTVGLLAAWPAGLEFMGRVLVVFIFNEAFAGGIGLATKGRVLKQPKVHGLIFLVSLGVVAAPAIADAGSLPAVAGLPAFFGALVATLATMLSFAGLWGEVYLITGIALDGGHHTAPSWQTITEHVTAGSKKGFAYSGYLMALLFTLKLVLGAPAAQAVMSAVPIAIGVLAGALLFPLLKTIIETFDGSQPFFERVRYSYRDRTLYARGAVAGFGFAYMITQGMFAETMSSRIAFGLFIGVAASAGVSVVRDAVYAVRGQGRVQSWRLYLTDGLLGAFVGSAAAFYLDARQVPVIVEKFKLYTSAGFSQMEYITYPLVNKWGRIDLGSYTGGAKLIFTESLAGVINWSIAAWLFAINKVFMQAYFEKQSAPIKFFFSKAGFAQLIEHMIYVLRWGLWMSPIIFTFLRMMPEPTWYNQDGAIRTLFAVFHNATMSPEAFGAWSLKVFVWVLVYDAFRVLIWMDHMGLRVATLVNLSFIGLDRLDERMAKFIGPAAAQRYIPEAVKRFCTWAPLLIPFYLPRGKDWDYAWSTSEAMQNAAGGGGLLATLASLTVIERMSLAALAVLAATGISFGIRLLQRRSRARRIKTYALTNRTYRVFYKENGEVFSDIDHQKRGVYPPEYDLTRRSYDHLDPSGRLLYLVDAAPRAVRKNRVWPVVGNFPHELFPASRMRREEGAFRIINNANGVETTVDIRLPDKDTTAEIWTVTIDNPADDMRRLKLVPYLEWVLNGGLHDRFHTQYARLFPEMEYVRSARAVLSWHKGTKSMGVLAVDQAPEGFLTSRMDFIGRAQSIWYPRALETFDFQNPEDTAPYPTFDPIGSLLLDAAVGPRSRKTIRLLIGYATDREKALRLVQRHLNPGTVVTRTPTDVKKKTSPMIGHGEILPGTPTPYAEFSDDGNKLLVHTPFTPRPYDHAMSNAVHSVMVTNRGLHTTCNGNSQQNRLTPDCPDTVTKELPVEAIYLYDPDRAEWYSPTHHPLNDADASNESEFGVDGTAVFRMRKGTLATELTVFVPPDEPAGIYHLTVKNESDRPRRLRVAPYFQMVLEFQPEKSGTLQKHYDKALNALFFHNPRNMFRVGWAFASMTLTADVVETNRGKFFGRGRSAAHPYLVEKQTPDGGHLKDPAQIAGLLGTLEIPARGECSVAVVLGQTDERAQAVEVVRKFQTTEAVEKSLAATKKWWLDLMRTVEVESNRPEFDRLLNWLKYQALAERIWARRGFYQTSGAYGYRDQLQDTVNLIWVEPALARKQLLLAASHQFIEGDVFHWFFTRTDGRTAFSCRSHASDNPLWLAWGVGEYVRTTGDETILDEMASYVISEFPFADLPKNKAGWGHLYHRATRADSVYRHCLRSIDLVFDKRMGAHGLPLIRTGDWNDGLDEIGSEGRGESVWLGFFLYYIMKDMVGIIGKKEGEARKAHYAGKMRALAEALENTWRDDRYLRAIHDDGTEIGVKDSGVWEIDALTAAWAVMSGINPEREQIMFDNALRILERDNAILLGWPALREDTKPYLGRSSKYPEGVRENGMYCHGTQWLIMAARILAERFEEAGDEERAAEYRETAYRLWRKITPISHITPEEIEIYGGQPNKQPADILTNFDQGRMIWHGYTGAAGWLLREAYDSVIGASLRAGKLILPVDLHEPRGALEVSAIRRDTAKSPFRLNGKCTDKLSAPRAAALAGAGRA